MKKIYLPFLLLVVICTVLYIKTSKKVMLPRYGQIKEFRLLSHENKDVTLARLRGKLWLVNFIFTNCPSQCPMMTTKVQRLQKSIRNRNEINFVSISIDPKNDSPEKLKKYIKKFNVDTFNWLFLTGTEKEIHSFARDSFKITSGRDDPNLHSTKFILVDRDGEIRGYYDSENDQSHILRDINSMIY